MLWLLYNVLFTVGYLAVLPRFLFRMWKRGGYRKGFLERFGVYHAELRERLTERRRIWIHAVSVGEIYVALHFMEDLRRAMPGMAFVLTTTTSTGHALAMGKVGADDVLIYFPTDFPLIVHRVIRILNPIALILTEGEIWPNLVRALHSRGTPVMVINGRLSASSHRGYRILRAFFRRVAACIDVFFVQSDADAARYRDLGVAAEKLYVMGSAKYDVAQPEQDAAEKARAILQEAGIPAESRILVSGSTWPGEEALLLDIYRRFPGELNDVCLVLVPRHAERRNEVETVIRDSGLPYVKRSELSAAPATSVAHPQILLVDTTGELKSFYACADLIFVGKSMGENHGGQNIIEPAMFGRPIVCGPNMENFPGVMSDFLGADAVVQAADEFGLEKAILHLLQEGAEADELGKRARQLVERSRGVVACTVGEISARLGSRRKPTNGEQKQEVVHGEESAN